MIVTNHRSRWPLMLMRAAGAFSGLCGLGTGTVAQAQGVSASAAPVEWIRYAEAATTAISGWLGEDGEAATRLRTYLDATRTAADLPTPPLELKLWIAPDGRIARIAFTPFAHAEANNDVRIAIVGRQLPSPPPKNMLLPLRIAVQLEP